MRTSLLALFLLLSPLAMAAPAPKPDTPILEAALKTAGSRQLPVLVDFHAPWCYSCYYMAQQVLVGPKWQAIERRTVVVTLDADSPEGAYWKTLWNVKALPSYVLLKAQTGGDNRYTELGRILAEQRQDEFIAHVDEILRRSSTLEDVQAQAAKGGGAGLKAVRQALEIYRARYDAAGLAWYRGLPAAVRRTYDRDSGVRLALARLELLQAAQTNDAARCQQIAPQVFEGELACERPYEISRWRECTASLPKEQRQPLLEQQKLPMQRLVDQKVFGQTGLCADQRSAVLELAGLYRDLGQKSESDALLRKAAARIESTAGKRLAADRNAADNWRVYLEELGDRAALDRLYPRLIQAWPDDYVYAFRYGRNLLARGDALGALPYLEQAAEKAYGQNRLKVAEQRVKALRELDLDAEARRVVAEALQANGPWFTEDVARLKASIAAGP